MMSIKKDNKKVIELIKKKKIFSDILNDQQYNQFCGVLLALSNKYDKKSIAKIIIENFCSDKQDSLDEIIIERLYLNINDAPNETYNKLIKAYES